MTLPSSSKVLTLLIQSPPLLGSMAMQQTVCQVVDSLELRTPLQVDNLVHQMLELACKVGDSLLLIKRKGSQVVMVEAQSQNIVLGKMSKRRFIQGLKPHQLSRSHQRESCSTPCL